MRILGAIGFAVIASSHAFACDSIAGALPSSACQPEVQVDWWVGTWATRMSDGGRQLTAFTRLDATKQYRTTLTYDDGTRVEHSGRYTVNFAPDLKVSYVTAKVSDLSAETDRIEDAVNK